MYLIDIVVNNDIIFSAGKVKNVIRFSFYGFSSIYKNTMKMGFYFEENLQEQDSSADLSVYVLRSRYYWNIGKSWTVSRQFSLGFLLVFHKSE